MARCQKWIQINKWGNDKTKLQQVQLLEVFFRRSQQNRRVSGQEEVCPDSTCLVSTATLKGFRLCLTALTYFGCMFTKEQLRKNGTELFQAPCRASSTSKSTAQSRKMTNCFLELKTYPVLLKAKSQNVEKPTLHHRKWKTTNMTRQGATIRRLPATRTQYRTTWARLCRLTVFQIGHCRVVEHRYPRM